mmetsp:Transcript_533/g.1628  ORF Transcript_533/g.1628 Transcript_533/m.1628 type:complete len:634 (-) Transcript_533:946-2847(-)
MPTWMSACVTDDTSATAWAALSWPPPSAAETIRLAASSATLATAETAAAVVALVAVALAVAATAHVVFAAAVAAAASHMSACMGSQDSGRTSWTFCGSRGGQPPAQDGVPLPQMASTKREFSVCSDGNRVSFALGRRLPKFARMSACPADWPLRTGADSRGSSSLSWKPWLPPLPAPWPWPKASQSLRRSCTGMRVGDVALPSPTATAGWQTGDAELANSAFTMPAPVCSVVLEPVAADPRLPREAPVQGDAPRLPFRQLLLLTRWLPGGAAGGVIVAPGVGSVPIMKEVSGVALLDADDDDSVISDDAADAEGAVCTVKRCIGERFQSTWSLVAEVRLFGVSSVSAEMSRILKAGTGTDMARRDGGGVVGEVLPFGAWLMLTSSSSTAAAAAAAAVPLRRPRTTGRRGQGPRGGVCRAAAWTVGAAASRGETSGVPVLEAAASVLVALVSLALPSSLVIPCSACRRLLSGLQPKDVLQRLEASSVVDAAGVGASLAAASVRPEGGDVGGNVGAEALLPTLGGGVPSTGDVGGARSDTVDTSSVDGGDCVVQLSSSHPSQLLVVAAGVEITEKSCRAGEFFGSALSVTTSAGLQSANTATGEGIGRTAPAASTKDPEVAGSALEVVLPSNIVL